MCFYQHSCKEADKILKHRNKTIIAYKIVHRQTDLYGVAKSLVGPWRSHYEYQIGLNKSNSRAKLCKKNNSNFNKGIHVFRTKNGARNYMNGWGWVEGGGKILIKVICRKEDLIAVNPTEMVFKNIYIQKKVYENALKGKGVG